MSSAALYSRIVIRLNSGPGFVFRVLAKHRPDGCAPDESTKGTAFATFPSQWQHIHHEALYLDSILSLVRECCAVLNCINLATPGDLQIPRTG